MNESQQQALRLLADVWELCPDVRLGQLMAHLGFLGEEHVEQGLGDLDDDELMAVMLRHKAELLARLSDPSGEPPQPTGNVVAVSGSSTQRLTISTGHTE